MKKLVLGIAMSIISISAFSQTAYEKAMTEKVAKIETCKTPEEFTALSNDFTRIADKEKSQFLPFYYSAFAMIQKGRLLMRNNQVAELDAVADEADKSIAKADELSPMNPEIYILKKLSHSLRMMVNPMQRYITEGQEAQKALEMAKKLQTSNPRITLLQAEDTYFTPEQFGGSKTKGLELFQKALDQYKEFKPKTALDPNWGQAEAEYFLKMKP